MEIRKYLNKADKIEEAKVTKKSVIVEENAVEEQ